MPEAGVIVGYIVGEKTRHYRRELKSGGPSAAALCGVKPDDSHWVENLNDGHAEARQEYPLCADCQAALVS